MPTHRQTKGVLKKETFRKRATMILTYFIYIKKKTAFFCSDFFCFVFCFFVLWFIFFQIHVGTCFLLYKKEVINAIKNEKKDKK